MLSLLDLHTDQVGIAAEQRMRIQLPEMAGGKKKSGLEAVGNLRCACYAAGSRGQYIVTGPFCPLKRASMLNIPMVTRSNVKYTNHYQIDKAKCLVYNAFMLFDIGEKIKKERKRQNITQEKMAQALGLSRTTIIQIESGTVQEVGVRKLIRILDYLGLELRVRAAGLPPTLDELREERKP
jgi:DNA-binding XRE family transcriptional regulator